MTKPRLLSSRHLALFLMVAFALSMLISLIIYSTLEDFDSDNPIRKSAGRQGKRLRKMLARGADVEVSRYDTVMKPPKVSTIPHVDPSIVRPAVEKLRLPNRLETVDEGLSYSIHECPAEIPKGYPMAWNVIDVLSHWNPDETEVPAKIHQGLCTLDWSDERQRQIAKEYRKAEVPFLLSNHDEIWETAERWSHFEYLSRKLDQAPMRNEYSTNNHMMFWRQPRGFNPAPEGWKPPTENVELSYDEWYQKAKQLEDQHDTANAEHWYFRLNGDKRGRNEFLYEELPIFDPDNGSTTFMVDPKDSRGINCRFGSKGIIAELHYDSSRNWILILQGRKRYILAHPDQCPNLELHPQGHPSARHSRINWSDPNDWHTGNFANAQVTEVVLQAGDLLYLPTAWFHFIVSLNLNYQCNARSGMTFENSDAITKCGFPIH